MQQVFIVDFAIHYQMCDDCRRVENKDYWRAVVQVRQKVETICFLPQKRDVLFLKHRKIYLFKV